MADKKPIAEVIHWFDKVSVAILRIEKGAKIKVGDKVVVGDGDKEFEQEIVEMQLNHESIEEAKAGMEIGVKFDQKSREGTKVYPAS